MGCRTVLIPGGFITSCTRGSNLPKCKFCGNAIREGGLVLCDWKLKGEKEGQTCDAPMCRRCAQRVGDQKDLCPPHSRVWAKDPRNPRNKVTT